MTRKLMAFGLVVLLAACGADGEPQLSGSTTVGVNSKSGVSTSTTIGIHFP